MMAANSDPTQVTSPKVKAAAIGGSLVFLALTLLVFVLDSADASWFQGAFEQNPALVSVLVGLATTAAAVIRGWKVPDPLRENYLAQLKAVEASREAHPAGSSLDRVPGPDHSIDEKPDLTG